MHQNDSSYKSRCNAILLRPYKQNLNTIYSIFHIKHVVVHLCDESLIHYVIRYTIIIKDKPKQVFMIKTENEKKFQ